MPQVARVGDVSSHGGTVSSGSPTVKAGGLPVIRAGDMHVCPIPGHGTTPFTSSSTRKANGKSIVRAGVDVCGCGATIVAGAPTVNITS